MQAKTGIAAVQALMDSRSHSQLVALSTKPFGKRVLSKEGSHGGQRDRCNEHQSALTEGRKIHMRSGSRIHRAIAEKARSGLQGRVRKSSVYSTHMISGVPPVSL